MAVRLSDTFHAGRGNSQQRDTWSAYREERTDNHPASPGRGMTTETRTPAHKARLLPQLIKFGAVGAVGFVVNLVVFNVLMLVVLVNVPHKTLFATAIATLVAIGANWLGNRYWAFAGNRSDNATREGVEFFVVSLAGMAI